LLTIALTGFLSSTVLTGIYHQYYADHQSVVYISGTLFPHTALTIYTRHVTSRLEMSSIESIILLMVVLALSFGQQERF